MKALINEISKLHSRQQLTSFFHRQSFAESRLIRQLLLTFLCLITPLLARGDPFLDFVITRAEINFESFPVINDAYEIRGELSVNITSEGIDPVNEGVRLAVGTSVIEIPAGEFTEVELGYFVFEGEVNGAGVIIEIIERDDGTFVIEAGAEGVDLTGTFNPIAIALRIGSDEGEISIRMNDELNFELSDDDDFIGDDDIEEEGGFEGKEDDFENEEDFHENEDDFEEEGDFEENDHEFDKDDEFPESTFKITGIEISYESFPSIDDAYGISGKIFPGTINDGINLIHEGVRIAFGTSVIEIAASAFIEFEPGYFVFEGEAHGAGVIFEIIARDDESFEFVVVAEGVDLSETDNPVSFYLTIGDDEYSALIWLDGDFAYVEYGIDEIPDEEESDDVKDGIRNVEDDDDDGNGISDIREIDMDGDGIVDSDDPDSDENVLLKGSGSQVGSNIEHPNGNVIDQVLLTGPSVELIADPEQISRVSFIDEDDDIVQVEFFGAGKLTIIIDPSSYELPKRPKKYNQDINYVKGSASIKVEDADESTFLSIFTVGRINAINQDLFPDGESYGAVANITLLEITNSKGFGGILCANTHFSASSGDVGLKAPGIPVAVRVVIGDIEAGNDAVPYLLFGEESFTAEAPNSGLRIAGGDLQQNNGASIIVAPGDSMNPGFEMLTTQNNFKSDGELQPAQSINATFINEVEAAVAVTTEEVTIE